MLMLLTYLFFYTAKRCTDENTSKIIDIGGDTNHQEEIDTNN